MSRKLVLTLVSAAAMLGLAGWFAHSFDAEATGQPLRAARATAAAVSAPVSRREHLARLVAETAARVAAETASQRAAATPTIKRAASTDTHLASVDTPE